MERLRAAQARCTSSGHRPVAAHQHAIRAPRKARHSATIQTHGSVDARAWLNCFRFLTLALWQVRPALGTRRSPGPRRVRRCSVLAAEWCPAHRAPQFPSRATCAASSTP